MRILQVASEMAPIAKIGGLADVVTGLSREIVTQGHDVTIVIPRYGVIDFSQLQYAGRTDVFDSQYNGESQKMKVEHFLFDNAIRVCLLDTSWRKWEQASKIYSTAHEDAPSYIQFSKGVLDWLQSCQDAPYDVFHVHDWQASFIAGLLSPISSFPLTFSRPRVVMTIHNLEYQGQCHFSELEKAGYTVFHPPIEDLAHDPHHNCANLLKLGIEASDIVTTVSATYAKEICSPDSGRGLDAVLRKKGEKFVGVLNGVDYSYWNPETDRYIPVRYSAHHSITDVLHAKNAARIELYQELGLEIYEGLEKRPLVASVTRLVEQKGLSLIDSVLHRAEELDITCILLGTAHDPKIHDRFMELNISLRNKKRGAVLLQNSEKIAHLIFAASDLFLVPSLFEPCGLTQIIAMKYGSIPVVRRTGGLADTVVDIDYPVFSSYVTHPNGFVFDHPDVTGIDSALHRSLQYFRKSPERWYDFIERALTQDFSWYRSASKYLELYKG